MIILFDLDGTLIDSTEAILESFHNAFETLGSDTRSDAAITALIGYPLDIMFSRLGVPEKRVKEHVTAYKEHYRVISREKTQLLLNAKEAVLLASKIAKIGIVTTKTAKYSQVLMEHFELMHYFQVLIGREDVNGPNPAAEPITKALHSFDANDKDIWMIGDTILDLKSAQNAGVNSIGVLSGYGLEDDLKKYTEHIFQTTLEAIEYLQSVR